MRSKLVSFILRYNWKAFILIFTFLIGGFLLIPACRLVPILINIISGKLSPNINSSESLNYPNDNIHYEIQKSSIYLPLITISNLDIEKPLSEIELNSSLSLIDTSPTGEQITIQIHQKENNPRLGSKVEVSFLPGEQCLFGDGRACMYYFDDSNLNRVILASVHSGIGGEGEVFRDLIEGTGLNLGLYTTEQVTNNIQSLIGSEIHINQGETIITGLVLHEIVRIPSAYIETYLSLPVDQTLILVEEITGVNLELVNQDLFLLETCGWRLPNETHISNYPNSMQSVYLGIFRFYE
jgi:hypothetical protein